MPLPATYRTCPFLVDGGTWAASPLQTQDILLEVLAYGGIFVVGFLVMWMGIGRFQTGRLIQDTVPARVRSIAIGRTELNGHARDAGVVFDQPFTDGTCLYYRYAVEQYVERKTRDKDGNVETERTWTTTSSHSLAAPFYLDDGTGQVLVVANAGADFQISDEHTFTKTFNGRQIPGQYQKRVDTSVDIADAVPADVEWQPYNLATRLEAKLPFGSIPGTANDVRPRSSGSPKQPDYSPSSTSGQILKRRISQTVLPVDEGVYVYGMATERRDARGANEQRLVIQGDDDTGRFIVSDTSEDKLASTFIRWGLIYLAIGLALSALAVYLFSDQFVVNLLVPASLRRERGTPASGSR